MCIHQAAHGVLKLNNFTVKKKTHINLFAPLLLLLLSHRLKKNLKLFIIVHPSWFIRTLLGITRPFIRSHCYTLHLADTLNCWTHTTQDRMYITGLNSTNNYIHAMSTYWEEILTTPSHFLEFNISLSPSMGVLSDLLALDTTTNRNTTPFIPLTISKNLI